MTFREKKEIINESHQDLKYNYTITGDSGKAYFAQNLDSLRNAITKIEDLDVIKPEIDLLKESSLFTTYRNEQLLTSTEHTIIKEAIDRIVVAIDILYRISNSNLISEESIFIKLPEIINFDDLAKLSNDLKKGIEIPILDQEKGGYVKIETAETGSIWLIISLGTLAAVNLIGGICWAAAVIRKKRAESKIFEEHARTLELKNNAIEIFVDAQKVQMRNILESEAEELAKQHYSANNPETIERLKLSISTVSDLIDKGTKILPASDNVQTLNNFPDFSKLNLIESTIKQISNN